MGREGVGFTRVSFQNPGHSGSEIFRHSKILEDPHQGFVTGHGVSCKKIILLRTGMNATCRGNFQPVSKNFKLWHQFGTVVVVNDGVDNGFTKGNLAPQASADTLMGSYFIDDTVLDSLQTIEYLLAGFNQATEAVILAFKQINPVSACIFSHLHRVAVLICQKVASIGYSRHPR